ncbi:MAG: LD-carboxypeptidase [Chloroflexi bacterium]|nr:MAG: LD-carboxypeptidase [Chloroflexota bacterium]
MPSSSTPNPHIKPRRLAPGQTIGITAPASPPNEPESTRFAIETVESFGLRVKLAPRLFDRHGYLAGDDTTRAAGLNDLFADEEVDAIFCLRGGYGASRLLPMLDYDLIRANPKILLGYSDITSLLLAIYNKTGLVTFHGPIASQAFTPYTLAEFKKVLFNPQPPMRIGAPPPFEKSEGRVEKANRVTTLVPGKAQGRLLGGNLSLVAHLTGTPYMPDLTGAILFLEDIGEAVYSIDRMLTQLWLSGNLQKLAGIAFGKFTEPRPSEWIQNRILEEVLAERARALGIPAVMGLMIGHVEDQTIVPLGCLAELDASAGTLALLEEPVK